MSINEKKLRSLSLVGTGDRSPGRGAIPAQRPTRGAGARRSWVRVLGNLVSGASGAKAMSISRRASAADVPLAIARAYYLAMMPPCGPTLVYVPVDDWIRLNRICDPVAL
jgi:hypothetical protein